MDNCLLKLYEVIYGYIFKTIKSNVYRCMDNNLNLSIPYCEEAHTLRLIHIRKCTHCGDLIAILCKHQTWMGMHSHQF